jgi:superfamily II DNA or RNA helicase
MKLDPKKLERQKQCFQKWLNMVRNPIRVLIEGIWREVRAGIIEAATGFGKTFIAIMTIKDMNERHPDRSTYVVVPTLKLKDDWTREKQVFNEKGEMILDYGHIVKHKLSNVTVFVVNTYVKLEKYTCDLLILDEAHHYAGKDAVHFNKVITITNFKFGMALSATLSKEQKEFFAKLGWRVADIVTPEECEAEGYTSTSITYNIGIPLGRADQQFNDDINEKFKNIFKKFDNEFELMKACQVGQDVVVSVTLRDKTYLGKKTGRAWREWLAKRRAWDGTNDHKYSPANIQKLASMGMSYMRKRKDRWQNMPSKLKYVEAIVHKFSKLKMIIFSETSDFADQIAALFPSTCLPYHTNLATLAVKGDEIVKISGREELNKFRKDGYTIKGKVVRKREAIELFIDPASGVNQISAVKALDEGADVPAIEVGLQTAYSSKERQDTQRSGRPKRIDYNNLSKKALLINLYMKGTQEEKWLRSKQAGRKFIRWVDSVEEISINHKISLYDPAIEEVPTTEVGIGDTNVGLPPGPHDEGIQNQTEGGIRNRIYSARNQRGTCRGARTQRSCN